MISLTASAAEAPGIAAYYYRVSAAGFGATTDMGAGVLVAPGKILTNCHITQYSRRIRAAKADDPAQEQQITLQAYDTDRDVCLLVAPGAAGPVASMGDSSSLKPGDPVYSFGYGRGTERISGLQGAFLRRQTIRGEEVLVTSSACADGDSGGGLFDRHGRLVGLVAAINTAAPGHECLAIPIERARQVLQRTPIAVQATPGARAFYLDPSPSRQ